MFYIWYYAVHYITHIMRFITQPWPWYVSGAAIALIMILLNYSRKSFGFSSNLRAICSLLGAGRKVKFFDYNWKAQKWNLMFLLGAMTGGLLSGTLLNNEDALELSYPTIRDLGNLGITFDGDLNPSQLFDLAAMTSVKGFLVLFLGGALVGFGSRYAGGCTSGHAISGLSNMQLPSLIAVAGFFIGGLLMTHLLFPLIF